MRAFNGEDIGSVRMYDSTRSLARDGSAGYRDSPLDEMALRSNVLVLVTALMSPLVTLIGVLLGQLDRRWLPATWLAATIAGLPWLQRFGNPALAPAIPLGALFVQLAAVWGFANKLLGRGLLWKGRRV